MDEHTSAGQGTDGVTVGKNQPATGAGSGSKGYRVVQTFDRNGETHEAGQTVNLTEEEARQLIDQGKIAQA